ncbi:hypothetical protein OV090_33900 [Nannocystis sp. RBIL2]|uniref:hypothetical protein n=1 Tax=Nannocystis sp. RBIL2 TaxID=2996788 RepID=UPI00226F3FCD|nr:hypothetical protein [Nannocystis sp. RBIL2]MCY1069784.1 hypothetical protein [Nannocystis sp. RBIL2]
MSDEERRRSLAALDAAAGAAYRASTAEQGRISQIWRERDDPHPLDVVEVLTADIGGYVSKILRGGQFESIVAALEHLRRMAVFEDPILREFCDAHAGAYPALMRYLETLEAVRLEAMAIFEAARDSRA